MHWKLTSRVRGVFRLVLPHIYRLPPPPMAQISLTHTHTHTMHETASPSKHTSLKQEPKVMSAETPPVLFQEEMNVRKRITLISTIAVFFMLIALPCLVMLLLFERIVDTKISEVGICNIDPSSFPLNQTI